MLTHLVPAIAAALVLKAILDISEGHNPLASIVSALFLLGIQGLFAVSQGWNDGSSFATTDFLVNAWNYLASSALPAGGVAGRWRCGVGLCAKSQLDEVRRFSLWTPHSVRALVPG